MRQKPPIDDRQLASTLENGYGLALRGLKFVPLGEASWCYVARDIAGDRWFIKIRKGDIHGPEVLIPAYLRDHRGFDAVLPAIANMEGKLWDRFDRFGVVVYPFVRGKTAKEREPTAPQWRAIGAMIGRLHAVVSPEIEDLVDSERFVPKWAGGVRKVIQEATKDNLRGLCLDAATFLNHREQEILSILERAEALGRRLHAQHPPFVLCHGDPNRANIFITDAGQILMLDWDAVLLAPKERDLMFFTGKEKGDFMEGYDPAGTLEINLTAIAYYAYEWVVQELWDFGERIFFSDLDDAGKRDAMDRLSELFDPHDVVQAAYEADAQLTGAPPA